MVSLLQDCKYHRDSISITFSDTQRAKDYTARMLVKNKVDLLEPINACYHLEWLDCNNNILKVVRVNSQLNIQQSTSCKLSPIPNCEGAVRLGVKVFFESKLMCYVICSLLDSEVLD